MIKFSNFSFYNWIINQNVIYQLKIFKALLLDMETTQDFKELSKTLNTFPDKDFCLNSCRFVSNDGLLLFNSALTLALFFLENNRDVITVSGIGLLWNDFKIF